MWKKRLNGQGTIAAARPPLCNYDALYARWIGTYASEEFGGVVRAVLDATERTAARVGDAERETMRRHFVTTSRYEWMFWEMGYRRESWPL